MITSHCLACNVGMTAAKADWPSLGAQILSVPACRIAGGATFAGPVGAGVDSPDDEQPDRASTAALAMAPARTVFFTVPPRSVRRDLSNDRRLSIDRHLLGEVHPQLVPAKVLTASESGWPLALPPSLRSPPVRARRGAA